MLFFFKFLQDLLVQLDQKKAILLSMNLISKDVLRDCTTVESKGAQSRLSEVNARYETLCTRASRWHRRLQQSLVNCDDLQATLDDLAMWVDSMQTQLSEVTPLDLMSSDSQLRDVYDRLKVRGSK